ncbi:hypothetical protein [Ekhidna sp.]
MKKIEELTLYQIEQNKVIKEKNEQIFSLDQRLKRLEKLIENNE